MNWTQHHAQAFDRMPVLVTGAAGFIGSHLVEALVTLGAKVTALDDLSAGNWANLTGFGDSVRQITGSILDPATLADAAAGSRHIFHLAALGSVPRSIAEPDIYYQVNVLGTLNVLQAARAAGTQRVIFAGSSSAYGDPPTDRPKHESQPPLPRSPYAATKLVGEHSLRAWHHSYGLDSAVLRYFNIFGPRQTPDSAYAAVIAAFAKALQRNTAPTIFGDGSQSRDFTYVANAVHANLLAARATNPLAGNIYNVACAKSVSLNQLFTSMARLYNRSHLNPSYAPQRPGDVMHSLADISAARQVLGYEPLIPFDTGLELTVRWYQQNL